MKEFRITKQGLRELKKLSKSNPNMVNRIGNVIQNIRRGEKIGGTLQVYTEFRKVRVGKYRLIHTEIDQIVIIAIIEKRETVYDTFSHLLKNSNFLN